MATSKEISRHGKGSDFYEEISEVCQPCSVEGNSIQADRFCVECQDYLCKKCWTYHKKLRATQNHDLVSIDEAKTAEPSPSKDKCSYKCSLHTAKSLKYFCVSHSYLGCSVCMTMDHSQCQTKEYIPKVAEDVRNYDGFKKFDEKLKALQTACKASMTEVENNLKHIGSDERKLKEAIKEFRRKINNTIDKLENEISTQAQKISIDETQKLDFLSKKLATCLANVDTMLNQVDNLLSSGKNCDTYVLMRKEASHLVSLNDEIVNATKGKTYKRFEFKPNNEIFKVGAFGKLSCRTENVSLRFEKTSSNDPAKMSRKVSNKPCTDSIARSKQIQPGTRVGDKWGLGGRGTVEHYDSSRGRWYVRWDNGTTGYSSTAELEILK